MRRLRLVMALLGALVFTPGITTAKGGLAPEFPAGLDWLNTPRPYTMQELRGKVVLLDFWTFACVNCMHVLPDLHRLELKYPGRLVVLGVHSAKFSGEQSTQKIRSAVLRYQVTHPVLNDRELKVWRLFDVHAWPTLVLIGPDGRIVKRHEGEGAFVAMDKAIAALLDGGKKAAKAAGTTPMPVKLEKVESKGLLRFPGKVLADAKSGRLFVADSGHDRVLVIDLKSGAVLKYLAQGLKDPQGMALSADGSRLYVASTGNHSVLEFVLGSGAQRLLADSLNSPWDLVARDNKLYIAMAGDHQIWSLDPEDGEAEPYAGSGAEAIADGSLETAKLAQPSGLSQDAGHLYSADSESSSIRRISPGDPGAVETLVGKGLFDFGDVEGDRTQARLQHPLGVHFHGGLLYVADSYNNRIKIVDPDQGGAKNFAGDGKAGLKDGAASVARFDEPGGLGVADGKLYVADTNNHAIRVLDLANGRTRTFRIQSGE